MTPNEEDKATHKAMKAAYKEMSFKSGVFQIRNIVNDKIYISSSKNLAAIWNREKLTLNFGTHRCPKLQLDWDKFGEANFVFEVLCEIEPKEGDVAGFSRELKAIEKKFKKELNPYNAGGYNAPLPIIR